MIQTIKSIENFKNIENLKNIELAPITLISGQNNVGKSNLLEAIFLFHDRLNPECITRLFNFRRIYNFQINPESIFGTIFHKFDMSKKINISIKRNDLPETLTINSNPDYLSQTVSLKPEFENKKISLNQNFIPSYALDMNYEKSGNKKELAHLFINNEGLGIQVEFSKPILASVTYLGARVITHPQEDSQRYGAIDLRGEQDIILQTLKIIEPRLKSLSAIVIGDISIIHGDIGLGRKLPINLMGDGISKLLSIVLAIANAKNGIVLIDEIDNGFYYSVIPKIWETIIDVAQKYNCQIIATTHSYECIQAVTEIKNINKENFKFIRLERNKELNLVTKEFDIEDLILSKNNNWEVR